MSEFRLRAWTSDDIAALPALANDMFVARYMTRRFPHPYLHDDAENWWGLVSQQRVQVNFAIEVDGELAGGIGLNPLDDERFGTADVGYWLGRFFWGRGIATQALNALVRYGFDDLCMRRLQAHVMAPNIASARVLEHAGFTFEATLPAFYVDRTNTVQDVLQYALLSSRAESRDSHNPDS